MVATINSGRCAPAAMAFLVMAMTLGLYATARLVAQEPAAAQHAKSVFDAQLRHYKQNTNDAEIAWQFGKAAFDWAEFAENHSQREQIATWGIAACRRAAQISPHSAPAHYWLAMNLGQLARTKHLGALRLVNEMEREFQRAANLDEKLDYAGPNRNLGQLYRDAPGWPTSIGNRNKARQNLERAAQLWPNYPENLLELADACAKWNDRKNLQRAIAELEIIWPEAKKTFSGEQWRNNWADWTQRFEKIKSKAAQLTKPSASPKSRAD